MVIRTLEKTILTQGIATRVHIFSIRASSLICILHIPSSFRAMNFHTISTVCYILTPMLRPCFPYYGSINRAIFWRSTTFPFERALMSESVIVRMIKNKFVSGSFEQQYYVLLPVLSLVSK